MRKTSGSFSRQGYSSAVAYKPHILLDLGRHTAVTYTLVGLYLQHGGGHMLADNGVTVTSCI